MTTMDVICAIAGCAFLCSLCLLFLSLSFVTVCFGLTVLRKDRDGGRMSSGRDDDAW